MFVCRERLHEHTSLALRLQRGTSATEPLEPLVSGLADDGEPQPRLGMSFGDYRSRAAALLAEHLERQRDASPPRDTAAADS